MDQCTSCAQSSTEENQPFSAVPDVFSTRLSVNLTRTPILETTIDTNDLRDLDTGIFSRRYNIIITDPPYGFNVLDETTPEAIPELYVKFLELVVKSVKSGGQIVFCVPSFPMNGQSIPFIMTSGFIIKHFLTIAQQNGRLLRKDVWNLPVPEERFMPPFFWESERALRRAVLHFQVFDA